MNISVKEWIQRHWTLVALVLFAVTILLYYSNLLNPDKASSPYEKLWSTDIMNGVNIYPKESHFVEGVTCVYMPLYFVIVGNLWKVFGVDPVIGKLVSALSVLVIALVIYSISVSLSKRRAFSLIPPLIFLVYPSIVTYTSNQMKIDLLGLAFGVVGLWLAYNKHYLWAVPFFVLGIFTKQYFIAAPLAMFVYLLFKDRSALIKSAILFLVLMATGFIVGEIATGGTFFQHTVVFMRQPTFGNIELKRVVWGLLVCLGYLAPVLILSTIGIWRTRFLGLPTLYLVVSLVVLIATIGKVGSGTNYTFDALVAGCILASLMLKKRLKDEISDIGSSYCPTDTPSSSWHLRL